MDLTWWSLALGAAVAWGSADFLAGLAAQRARFIAVVFGVQSVGLLVVLPFWMLYDRTWRIDEYMVAAGLAMVCGLSALYRGLARGPVRIVAPVSALGAGIPVLYGALTGEDLSLLRAAGAVLALLGIVTVTAGESAAEGGTRPGAVAAVLHGAGAALGLGAAVVLLGLGGPAAPFASVGTVRLTAAAFAGAALVLGARSERCRKDVVAPRALGLVLGAGVLDCAANIAFVLAAQRGAVGLSGLLASLYPAVTVVLGVLVLGERLTRWQVGGLGLVFAGVVLLRF